MIQRSANTGPIVPAWIREQIRRQEAEWPLAVLAAATGTVLLGSLLLGVRLWMSGPVAYYVRP